MGQCGGTFFFDFVFNSDPRDEDEAKSLSLYQTDSGRYPSSQQYHSGTRPMGRGVVFPQKIVRLNNPGMEDIYFGGMVKFLFVSIFRKRVFYSVHLCLQFQAEHFQLVHET